MGTVTAIGETQFFLKMRINSNVHRWQQAFVAGDGSRNVKCGIVWITGKI
jgi:hypothetical protein